MVIKNKEGISFKRLLALLVSKMTGIFNVKINLIQLDNPSRVMRRQFNILKRTTRARGRLKNEVYDIILVLYQSMILKYPQMLNNYLVPLIRYNIKNVRQIFLILSNLFPYFCKVLKFRGIKIELKGRINGSKRTQITKLQYGMVPLMGIADSLHYSYNKVMTIHGVYSLRV